MFRFNIPKNHIKVEETPECSVNFLSNEETTDINAYEESDTNESENLSLIKELNIKEEEETPIKEEETHIKEETPVKEEETPIKEEEEKETPIKEEETPCIKKEEEEEVMNINSYESPNINESENLSSKNEKQIKEKKQIKKEKRQIKKEKKQIKKEKRQIKKEKKQIKDERIKVHFGEDSEEEKPSKVNKVRVFLQVKRGLKFDLTSAKSSFTTPFRLIFNPAE
jgi:hypothetical protein